MPQTKGHMLDHYARRETQLKLIVSPGFYVGLKFQPISQLSVNFADLGSKLSVRHFAADS